VLDGRGFLGRDSGFFGASSEEDLDGCPAFHAAALMRSFMIVGLEEDVEVGLHLDEVFVPDFAALNAEVFVEQGAVEAFEEAVALRAADLSGAVGDAFELEEKLVGMAVGSPAEFPAVVGEDGFDGDLLAFEEGQDVVVEEVDSGERQLGGVEPGEGEARVAVDGGLGVDAADAFEVADVEGVHGEQRAGVRSLDVAVAELRIEAFEQADLLIGELDRAFAGVLFEAQQALVLGEQIVAFPDAADAA